MRSYEDKWAWLRSEVQQVKATLENNVDQADPPHITKGLRDKLVIANYVLRLMDQADRNGPVEPL